MAYWSTEKIKATQAVTPLVDPYDPERVQQGAYELSMGSQAAISCDGPNQIANLKPRQVFCIPRGQFALLLTEERVLIPANVVAFISLKTTVKSYGLINVSGFHVDPGFKCRLKFWVYNAGNEDIHLLQNDPLFLIWFSDLDRVTEDVYTKNRPYHNEITADDLRRLRGTLASPAALAKQVEQLENKVKMFEWVGGTALVILIGLCIALATPLLDYLIKPVLERFPRVIAPVANSAAGGIKTPASPALLPSAESSVPVTTTQPSTLAPASGGARAIVPTPKKGV